MKKEFRITRPSKFVRGTAGSLVPAEDRMGYYINAKSADEALRVMANRYPGEEVELG